MKRKRGAFVCAVLLILAPPVSEVSGQVGRDRQSATQRPGQAPPALPPQPVTQLDARLKTDSPQHVFSLTFSEPVAIKDLLLLAVQDTGYSVVVDPDVEGTFTGELKNVTLKQALDAALPPLHLEYSIENNILHVYTRKIETRLFNFNYVSTRRSGNRSMSVSRSVGASASSVASSDFADLFAELEKGIQTLLSPQGKYNVDRKAGVVQATDYPDRLDKIGLYLDLVQLRVNRQVHIQAKVIEVALDEHASAGIDWAAVIRRAGESVSIGQPPSTAAPLTLGLRIRDFNGLLKALETQGRVNVLSSPHVAAMNNEPVLVRVGTDDVYFETTSQVDQATGRLLQTTVTPHAINEGLVLNLTPQVSGDGMVTMSVSPSVTERAGEVAWRRGSRVPITASREADTVVRVREGDSVIVAGLMHARPAVRRSKVPVLGDIPILGAVFRQEVTSTQKTELVIVLTPGPAAVMAKTDGR